MTSNNASQFAAHSRENRTTAVLREWLSHFPGALPVLYLVGGAVRDLMLCQTAKDIDLVCRGAKRFARKLAAAKNAAVVAMEKKANEPCYRVVDRSCTDNFIDVAELRGETIEEDLGRRDFTINAMAIEVGEEGGLGESIDPFHGMDDLEKRSIRVTSAEAFVSDPLRILRAVRFAAKLNFEIEAATLSHMARLAYLVPQVSFERITSELLVILETPTSCSFFQLLDRLGVLEALFPEIQAMKGCTQNSHHHRDVWQHSLMVMENCETIIDHPAQWLGALSKPVMENLCHDRRLPLLKLAALLHDAGKPAARQVNPESGRITFYGHDGKGSRIADEVGQRLKLSNRDRTFLSSLVAEHPHVLALSAPEVRPATRMRWFRRMKDDAVPAIILSMADIEGTLGPDSTEESRSAHIEWCKSTVADYYQVIKKRIEQQSLISGNDLLALGMKAGPDMGRVLKNIEEARDAGEIHTRDDALKLARQFVDAVS